MNQSRLLPIVALTATALALAACAQPTHSPYENLSGDEPGDMVITGPTHYQGTSNRYQGAQGGTAIVNSQDAAINANVINAVTTVPGVRNLQVGTLHGIVTLRGIVDSQATGQQAVQTAQQIPGVRSVDYDLQIIP